MNEKIIKNKDLMLLTMAIGSMPKDSYLRERLVNFFDQLQDENCELLLHKAVKDGHIKKDKINWLIKKYDVDRNDVAEIFKHIYDEGFTMEDGKEEKQPPHLLTMKESGIWKMRKWIEKNFNLKVIGPEEMMKKMEDDPMFNEFMESMNPEIKSHLTNYIG